MSLLGDELGKINWVENVNSSLLNADLLGKVDVSAHKNAVWISQVFSAEQGNPALAFLTETAALSQQAPALACCCYYRSAVSASRAIVESALYYTYFRNHQAELATLLRDQNFYISKSDVLDFHKIHTENFNTYQSRLNFISSLDKWYKKVSSVTHAQVPGNLSGNLNLADLSFDKTLFDESISIVLEAWEIVNRLFFSTLSQDLWRVFSPDAKITLLKGMSGDTRKELCLDKK